MSRKDAKTQIIQYQHLCVLCEIKKYRTIKLTNNHKHLIIA